MIFYGGFFDIVIGNPPYGVSIKDEYRTNVLKSLGKVPDFEIYYYFIEVAKTFLKVDGIKSYIIPNTFLFNVFASEYRKKLLERWKVKIVDCTAFKIFEGATVYNAITIFSNSPSNESIKFKITKNAETFEDLIKNSDAIVPVESVLKNNQNWSLLFKLDDKTLNLIQKIKTFSKLSDYYDVTQGYIPYRKSDLINQFGKERGEQIVKNREWHSTLKIDEDYKEEIWGESLNKYTYQRTRSYIKYGKHLATYVDLKYFNQKRVLVREITNPQIIACLVEEEFVNDPQIINIIEKENSPSLDLLWAILNSKLSTFFHFNSSPKATKGAFPKILIFDINNFPLPFPVNKYVEDKLANQIDRMFKLKRQGLSVKAAEVELDLMIYKIYGLEYNDVKIIEPELELNKSQYDADAT